MTPSSVFGSIPEFADDNFIDFEVRLDQIQNGKILSFEDAVQRRMHAENISLTEARNRMIEEENSIIEEIALKRYNQSPTKSNNTTEAKEQIERIKNSINPRAIINYVSVEQVFSYQQNTRFKACLEAELRIVQDTSTSYFIDRVMGLSSRRHAGMYNYSWHQTASDYDFAPGKKSVYMWVKGYFEVRTTTNVGISGFYLNASVGDDYIYLSSTVKGTRTYSVR